MFLMHVREGYLLHLPIRQVIQQTLRITVRHFTDQQVQWLGSQRVKIGQGADIRAVAQPQTTGFKHETECLECLRMLGLKGVAQAVQVAGKVWLHSHGFYLADLVYLQWLPCGIEFQKAIKNVGGPQHGLDGLNALSGQMQRQGTTTTIQP